MTARLAGSGGVRKVLQGSHLGLDHKLLVVQGGMLPSLSAGNSLINLVRRCLLN